MGEASTIAELRERIDILEEENRQLQEALYPDEMSPMWRYGLTKCEIALFNRLLQTELATRETLVNVLEATTRKPGAQRTVDVMMHKIRRKLKHSPHKIHTVWGIGYRLEKCQ